MSNADDCDCPVAAVQWRMTALSASALSNPKHHPERIKMQLSEHHHNLSGWKSTGPLFLCFSNRLPLILRHFARTGDGATAINPIMQKNINLRANSKSRSLTAVHNNKNNNNNNNMCWTMSPLMRWRLINPPTTEPVNRLEWVPGSVSGRTLNNRRIPVAALQPTSCCCGCGGRLTYQIPTCGRGGVCDDGLLIDRVGETESDQIKVQLIFINANETGACQSNAVLGHFIIRCTSRWPKYMTDGVLSTTRLWPASN